MSQLEPKPENLISCFSGCRNYLFFTFVILVAFFILKDTGILYITIGTVAIYIAFKTYRSSKPFPNGIQAMGTIIEHQTNSKSAENVKSWKTVSHIEYRNPLSGETETFRPSFLHRFKAAKTDQINLSISASDYKQVRIVGNANLQILAVSVLGIFTFIFGANLFLEHFL